MVNNIYWTALFKFQRQTCAPIAQIGWLIFTNRLAEFQTNSFIYKVTKKSGRLTDLFEQQSFQKSCANIFSSITFMSIISSSTALFESFQNKRSTYFSLSIIYGHFIFSHFLLLIWWKQTEKNTADHSRLPGFIFIII